MAEDSKFKYENAAQHEALVNAAAQFRTYEASHAAKADEIEADGLPRPEAGERRQKAERNRAMAELCEAALATPGRFYNRVSGEPIPDDEPVIIFRARDIYALSALTHYRILCEDEHHRQAVQDVINAFEIFGRNHPERMKEPGITHHVKLASEDLAHNRAGEEWPVEFHDDCEGGAGRNSIKKSHRAEGRNFVD